jgi:hypothetical protein
MAHSQAVKTVGVSGRFSLGKRYAGRPVLIEQLEEGVWLVKIARIIPANELWTHREPAQSRIDQALAWAKEHPPAETDLESLSAGTLGVSKKSLSVISNEAERREKSVKPVIKAQSDFSPSTRNETYWTPSWADFENNFSAPTITYCIHCRK